MTRLMLLYASTSGEMGIKPVLRSAHLQRIRRRMSLTAAYSISAQILQFTERVPAFISRKIQHGGVANIPYATRRVD